LTKDLFIELYDKLGRDPTDDEMADAMADKIDSALERAQEDDLLRCAGCLVPRDSCGVCRITESNFKYTSWRREP